MDSATAGPIPVEGSKFDLADLKRLYAEARDNTRDARKASEECFDYYAGKQLSPTQVAVLQKRKQPEIWINRIAPAVNGILGVLEQGESDPRAFPRNDADNDAAEVATDALRYAADRSRWRRTKLDAAKNCLIGGVAAVIVEVNEDRDPWPRVIRDGEFLYDPHSRDKDFEDARYMGVAKWMYVDAVKGLYPNADIDADTIAPTSVSFDDNDKPVNTWTDAKRNRVLVVELYIDQKGWQRVVFYGGAILEQSPSPYKDEKGNPTNPIVAQSALVDRDNARYGLVKDMVPIQDEINMRRSRLLHLANSRQLQVTDPQGSPVDADTARTEAARPDGVLPPGYGPVQTNDLATGQVQLLAESKAELERMGPNPAVLGQSVASTSGRAQLVRQQAGMTELTYILGSIEDLELRVFRAMWERIKQFWTDPKWVRVTDDIGAPKFLMVNEPVHQEVPGIVPHPQTGQPMVGTQKVQVGVKNRPAEMDMDIIIDASPDTANLAAEQFSEIMKLVPIYGKDAFPLEMVIKASALPKKRELLEALEAQKQEAAQQAQQGQGPQQAIMQAELQVKQAKAALDAAKAQGEEIKNHILAHDAGQAIGQSSLAAEEQQPQQPPQQAFG